MMLACSATVQLPRLRKLSMKDSTSQEEKSSASQYNAQIQEFLWTLKATKHVLSFYTHKDIQWLLPPKRDIRKRNDTHEVFRLTRITDLFLESLIYRLNTTLC